MFFKAKRRAAPLDAERIQSLLAEARTALAERRFDDAQFHVETLTELRPLPADHAAAWTLHREALRRSAATDGTDPEPQAYSRWYYRNLVWQRLSWMGQPLLKSVEDCWNYQEIVAAMRPRLIVEFGTNEGGSTRFFRDLQRLCNVDGRVLTVDIDHRHVQRIFRRGSGIELLTCSSTDPRVARRIGQLRRRYRGPMFVILDSDHRADHVYGELRLLREVTRAGDYVVVEDGIVNGHPVRPDYGPGPYEAIERYVAEFPGDYRADRAREHKFGFTWAPLGYLERL